MKTFRLKKVSVVQTSLVAAIIYFFLTLIMIFPMGLFMGVMGLGNTPGFFMSGIGLFFVAPFLYAIIGFLITALGCAIYNLVAKWTGGVEFDLEEVENNPNIG